MRPWPYLRHAVVFALLVSSLAQTPLIQGETVRYLPAKDFGQFRVALAGGGNRTNPKGVFEFDDSGTLQVSGRKPGFLISKRSFSDYSLVVEYRWKTSSPDRDSGVFVNSVPKSGRYTALECDLPKPSVGLSGRLWLFGRPPKGITASGRRYTTGGPPPMQQRSLESPIGEWNVMEVYCRGGTFRIKLNGTLTAEGSNPTPRSGAIMLQSSSGAIEFRKLEVTVLPKLTATRKTVAPSAAEKKRTASAPVSKKPRTVTGNPLLSRGNPESLARKGLWSEAAQAYADLIRKDPKRTASIDGLKLGLLYAASGDREAHATLCRAMQANMERWKTPGDGGRPAKAWAALPNAIDNGMAENARRGAEHATKHSNHPAIGWFSLTRAMVDYRQGRNRESLGWSRKPANHKDAAMRSSANAFAAMASHRLGNNMQAEQSLAKAVAAFAAITIPSKKDLGPLWHNYLAAKLALDEANSLLAKN